jgi:hypothetical protein
VVARSVPKILSAGIYWRRVAEVCSAEPHGKSPSVFPTKQAGVVLQFVVVLHAEGMTRRRSPADEGAQDLNRRRRFFRYGRNRSIPG